MVSPCFDSARIAGDSSKWINNLTLRVESDVSRGALLVICPASIRRQWALALAVKLNLPAVVLDATARRDAQRNGTDPFKQQAVPVVSYHFARMDNPAMRGGNFEFQDEDKDSYVKSMPK